jgi:putative transposase
MNKTIRFQILYPQDCEWKQFNDILNDFQKQTGKIYNKVIQLCWEYNGFSSDYVKQFNNRPKEKEILGLPLMTYCEHKLRKEFPNLQSGNLGISLKKAIEKWNNDKNDIKNGKISIPSFKKDMPIDIRNDNSVNNIKLYQKEDDYKHIKYYLNLSLISQKYADELKRTGKKKCQFEVLIHSGDKSSQTILNRLISGQYKISASQILSKKGKWFINLCYSFESKSLELDVNNIMGIDMGIVYPVYMAFNNSLNRYKIDGGEIDSFRKTVERRKNQLYQQGKYCGEGRIGHGIKTRIQPIEFAKDKVANFRDTVNHKYSKYIINMAIKHNCGIIQMEDLKGISKDNFFLKNWSYYDLQQKIEYKAKEVGIQVIKISPEYTSQRCNKCGYIDKENRVDQKTFKCKECGFETNADFNAARNISTKDIDLIIKEWTKEHWKKKEE